MADSFLTLNDVLFGALDASDAEVSDLRIEAALLKRLPAEESSNGTTHSYVKRTSRPATSFRTINNGKFYTKSGELQVDVTLKLLDFSSKIDVALLTSRPKGRGADLLARESLSHLASALFDLECQIINGTNYNANGSLGFADTLSSASNDMVVDAGGTGTTSGVSSVYFVRTGHEDVVSIYNGNNPVNTNDPVLIDAQDGSGKSYGAWYMQGHAWGAVQMGSIWSVCRVANLDSVHPFTDDLAMEALSRFPAGRKPNLCVMNQTSLAQLQQSRSAFSPTGAPAAIPQDVHGVEIVVTDAITDEEADI